MSCQENEKVFCCKKFYKKIFSYNSNTDITESTTFIEPIWCATVCPDDCITNSPNPASLQEYVTTVVDSCEECLDSGGCEVNLALIFDPNTCNLEEVFVASENEASQLATSPKRLVAYIECLSTKLSVSKTSTYHEILNDELRKTQSCYKPCCYKLDNEKTGCIKLPPQDCNNQYVQKKLNINNYVTQTLVIEDQNDCTNINCFGQQNDPNPTQYSVPQYNCGACCIDNNCVDVCDVDKSNLSFYITNVLKLDATLVENEFANDVGIIRGQQICSALQGVYRGYNTLCENTVCTHTKIITK